jgi:GMP reductase
LHNVKLDFEDVLLVPRSSKVVSRANVNLVRTINGKWGSSITGVPIIAANMDGVGTFAMARQLGKHQMFTALVKYLTKDTRGVNKAIMDLPTTFITIGMCEEELDFVTQRDTRNLVIDVANGHLSQFVEFVKIARQKLPKAFIIAGNVVTARGTQDLLNAGADLAKIGIGSGAACTTRRMTGVGYPQLSAVMECARAAKYVGGGVVSDGGCVYPGDFAKAFAAGAEMVMAGTFFAGHEEGGKIDDHGYATFYGMSTHTAQKVHHSEVKDYRASEGRVTRIPGKGPVENTVKELLGGIRSACTYLNAESIEELKEDAEFIQVHNTINRTLEPYTVE